WGDPYSFVVTLGRASDDTFAEVNPPTSRPTATVVGGSACEAIDSDRVQCVPGMPGPVTVRIDYPGDAHYLPFTQFVQRGEAIKRTPTLTANLDAPLHL